MVAAAFECIRATDLHNLHRFLVAGLRESIGRHSDQTFGPQSEAERDKH